MLGGKFFILPSLLHSYRHLKINNHLCYSNFLTFTSPLISCKVIPRIAQARVTSLTVLAFVVTPMRLFGTFINIYKEYIKPHFQRDPNDRALISLDSFVHQGSLQDDTQNKTVDKQKQSHDVCSICMSMQAGQFKKI